MSYSQYTFELQEVVPVGTTKHVSITACNKAHALSQATLRANRIPNKLMLVKNVHKVNSVISSTQKEDSLIHEMSITDSQKALNKANLVDEKLKVVEARLSTYHSDFNRVVDNHVERLKADMRNNLLPTITEVVQRRIDSRHQCDTDLHTVYEVKFKEQANQLRDVWSELRDIHAELSLYKEQYRKEYSNTNVRLNHLEMWHKWFKEFVMKSRILRWLFKLNEGQQPS